MSIFKPSAKLEGENAEAVTTLISQVEALKEELSASQATLTGIKTQLEATKTELATAQTELNSYKIVERLQGKADDLGFSGDVSAILTEAKGDYTTALEALITSASVEKESLAADFQKSLNEPVGDSTTGEDELPEAKTQKEAIANMTAKYPEADKKTAVMKARASYPELFRASRN
jgi:DNA repair exonuclease SbcCD ATPase subunit